MRVSEIIQAVAKAAVPVKYPGQAGGSASVSYDSAKKELVIVVQDQKTGTTCTTTLSGPALKAIVSQMDCISALFDRLIVEEEKERAKAAKKEAKNKAKK